MLDFQSVCSRRKFITKTVLSGGILFTFKQLSFGTLFANSFEDKASSKTDPSFGWGSIPGRASYRYEGLAKVMGQKIFARDFSAADFENWPRYEMHGLVLRAPLVGKSFQGLNFSHIQKSLRPIVVITDKELRLNHIKVPEFFKPRLIGRLGHSPDYLGQPLAILLFSDVDVFLEAKKYYRNPEKILIWGKAGEPEVQPPYCDGHLIRYSVDNGEPEYSPATHGGFLPLHPASTGLESIRSKKGLEFVDRIQQDQDQFKWRKFEGEFSTQTVDPCFMEPENGICYFDEKIGKFHMAIGTQCPSADSESIADMFSPATCPIKLKQVELISCFPGGGFGGRDHSMFPLLLALAGVFSGKNRSVRIINDRFDQFQSGIKRHASNTKIKMEVDQAGKIQSLKINVDMPGGGQKNFSFAVPSDAAANASLGYFIPRADIAYRSLPTVGVPAGSMRGFGSVQVAFAVESMMDEIARTLQLDPLEFRVQNALEPGLTTIMGAAPISSVRVKEIIQAMQSHELWKNRKTRKRKTPDFYYGVGSSVTMMSFGTNQDAVLAEVSVDKDGHVRVITNGIDMGQGLSTTLAITPAQFLGRNADSINMGGSSEFDLLTLWTKECKNQTEQDLCAKDPRFTLGVSMGTIASASAFSQHHVVNEASRLLFETSLYPVAVKIWGKQVPMEAVLWKEGALSASGFPSLSWMDLVCELYKKDDGICAVMVHGFYRCGWSFGEFVIHDKEVKIPVDALAFKPVAGQYRLEKRRSVSFPSFAMKWRGFGNYNTSGCLTAVEVCKKTGVVRIEEIYSFLECGAILQKQIVEGQTEGALAMGIGQALYEELPENINGAGDGTWNFHRYQVPLYRHLPVQKMGVLILDPLEGEKEPKGMAEVVVLPVAPSIVNGICDAIGVRFYHLPVTPEKILRALL